MIDFVLKFQVVLFGSYEDISPKPDTIKYFIEAFQERDFVPTTFQEIGPRGPMNRLSLKSSDDVWNIEISSSRIDIEKVNRDIGKTEMSSLKDFLENVEEIIKIIQEKFPKKHNRISMVTRNFMGKMEDKRFGEIYRKLSNTIDLYKENEIVEWNNRVVTRKQIDIDSNQETINIISQINKVTGKLLIDSKMEDVNRIELQFDINTFQGNNEYRFELEHIKSFFQNVSKLEKEMQTDYLNLIQN